MVNQDRIRLAEAMGWNLVEQSGIMPMYQWQGPNGETCGHWDSGAGRTKVDIPLPFNPEHDANDCEALIRWLNDQHISVTISARTAIGVTGVRFDHDNGVSKEWKCDDWKQGVCELALKMINDSEN